MLNDDLNEGKFRMIIYHIFFVPQMQKYLLFTVMLIRITIFVHPLLLVCSQLNFISKLNGI